MLSQSLSQKFKFWSFVSMVLLVFVHGYNLEIRYLQPWTAPNEPITFTSFVEYLFANGLLRFRIPMLFAISGYLFALHDQAPHSDRIKKRARTLLAPYLIWSALALVFVFLLEMYPTTREWVISSQVVQIDNSRKLIHEYQWYEVIARWLFFPVAYQLWFIRVLFVYNCAYLGIRWCVTHRWGRPIFFVFAVLLWLATFGIVFIEGEGLLFFSLGVWMQKTGFNLERASSALSPKIWSVVFVAVAIVKTYLAFQGQKLIGDTVFPIITLLHKVTVFSGLVACWFGLDWLVTQLMHKKVCVWLSGFSFIIYTLHAPLVAILINVSFDWLQGIHGFRMIGFVCLPLLLIAVCVGLGAVLRKAAPGLYGLLTGWRGLA